MIGEIAELDLELPHARCLDWDKSHAPLAAAATGEMQPTCNFNIPDSIQGALIG